MKKCPYCAETDLQDDARICKHCGKELKDWWQKDIPGTGGGFGCIAGLAAIGLVIAGFFFWPLWILGAAFLIIAASSKKK